MVKKISLVLLVILYVGGGINHFIHPRGYIAIIPPWLPYPLLIIYATGIAEIVVGVLAALPKTRRIAMYGIITLLILFIPAHIYMIQKGGCMSENLCLPAWAAWLRLFPLQFVLMWWAWWHRK